MFLTGAFRVTGFSGPDPDQERDPPAKATQLTFPVHEPRTEQQAWTHESPPPSFQALFARILRPADISDKHLQALNITTSPPCSVDDMLPSHGPRSPYLLPIPDADAPPQTEDENLDPAAARRRKDFNDRVAELRIDNDLAFRTISRTVAEGIKPPRIAHMRRFWESVENMSQFWDASVDQYYETTETTAENGEEEGKGAKRLRLGSETNEDFKLVVGGKEIVPFPDDIPAETPQPRKRYKGRRIGAGTDMPDSYRSDTVKAFVEGTIWPFRTSLAPPRVMPIVQFGKLNLPVRQTAAVYQLPNDRTKARQGYLRGPILILQARPELGFERDDGGQDEEKARLDLMREIGGLLHLAQERRREAQEYVRPGEGQWWTTVPRWGGGPGGEVQNELGNSDIVDLVEGVREASQEDEGKKTSGARKSKRKEGNAVLWKELKAGKGNWDVKTEYAAIGREPESPYDEIFLVSSLNHHVSIVKATVHNDYSDCLTSGNLPDPLPQDPEWCRPKVQRTVWYDLFEAQQRLELFRALWGIMSYMTRFHEV